MKIPIYRYVKLLRRYLMPLRGQMVLLAVCLLTYIGMGLIAPQFLKRFINEVVEGTGAQVLLGLAITFGLVMLTHRALEVAVRYLSGRVSWAATNALREDFLQHCLSLSMAFHNGKTPGEMIERVDGDISDLRQFFSTFVMNLLGSALLLLGILACLFM
ncbi:MAG: ABC transporter transmembrane domain-containing protein, partial [Verrucomicrobiota bacterium]